jgi:hypothetical protein
MSRFDRARPAMEESSVLGYSQSVSNVDTGKFKIAIKKNWSVFNTPLLDQVNTHTFLAVSLPIFFL